jgi:vanillate O-demethylase monooxygenase subunit
MKPFEHEDLPMLEAQQARMGGQEFWSMQPALLPIDMGAIRARRVMERLIAKEAAQRAERLRAACVPIGTLVRAAGSR